MRATLASNPVMRKIGLGIVLSVAVILLLMWLSGAFHTKIDEVRPRADALGGALAARQEPRPPGRRLLSDAKLEPVKVIRVPATETAVGTIRAVHEASVASKLLAKVAEVKVIAGQKVAQGDVLVRLDDADLKARLQQAQAAENGAKASYDQAKIEFERIQKLFQEDHAAQIEFDRASTEVKSAEAALRQAEQVRSEAATILGYATIASPIDGVVIDKKVEAGDMVRPGQVLVALYDPTRMQLIASIRESLTHRLQVGQTIDVQVDALSKQCQGRVSEIVPEAESASRTFAVKVTGPCPPGIYTGMFGRLLIPLDDHEVLVVPSAAVRRIGQLDVVDVAEGDSVRRRAVQLGRAYDGMVEVLAGLRADEMVAMP